MRFVTYCIPRLPIITTSQLRNGSYADGVHTSDGIPMPEIKTKMTCSIRICSQDATAHNQAWSYHTNRIFAVNTILQAVTPPAAGEDDDLEVEWNRQLDQQLVEPNRPLHHVLRVCLSVPKQSPLLRTAPVRSNLHILRYWLRSHTQKKHNY